MPIAVGQTAPVFALKDQDQKDIKLSDFDRKTQCRTHILSARLQPYLHQRACLLRE